MLEAAVRDHSTSAKALREYINTAQIANFENTGGGFFSTLYVPPESSRLTDKSPLDVGTGSVDGIEHGMGFLLFIENGLPSMIEGYAHANVSTQGIDFSTVGFEVKAWSAASK